MRQMHFHFHRRRRMDLAKPLCFARTPMHRIHQTRPRARSVSDQTRQSRRWMVWRQSQRQMSKLTTQRIVQRRTAWTVARMPTARMLTETVSMTDQKQIDQTLACLMSLLVLLAFDRMLIDRSPAMASCLT